MISIGEMTFGAGEYLRHIGGSRSNALEPQARDFPLGALISLGALPNIGPIFSTSDSSMAQEQCGFRRGIRGSLEELTVPNLDSCGLFAITAGATSTCDNMAFIFDQGALVTFKRAKSATLPHEFASHNLFTLQNSYGNIISAQARFRVDTSDAVPTA
ncbi:hypothetical protein BS47DRAFT_1357578 [Hydnum rufescens UP504]|uniref:Uncharacterized protein n=1 Tax=Hydnum rufescens UP504 TaxID=1448309 RepID=A0A9P6BBE8_9AGAM|nr:hypothetical protein BS47DRAFT_1357578 [Hydnum rufescens UP504]